MKIEEAIKIKRFINEFEKLVINITYTASWIRLKQIQFFKTYELSPEQYNVLRILRGQYPEQSNIILIQERMIERMSNASRLVDKLVKKDLVLRKECPEDRRQVDVIISQNGLTLLEKINQEIKKVNENMFKCDEKEAKMINNSLDRIRK